MEKVLITEEFRRIDKTQWPLYVREFVENPDLSSIHAENGTKIAFRKFNTEAFPRLLIFEEKDGKGNIVYVPRKYFKDHRQYEEYRNKGKEEQLKIGKYFDSEKEELKNCFASFEEEAQKPPLPVEMRDYERKRDFSNTETTYVFEMEEYCKSFKQKELENDRREILKALQGYIIDHSTEPAEQENGWRTLPFLNGAKQIVVRQYTSDGHAYYFLFDIGADMDIGSLGNKYTDTDFNVNSLIKQARKGYPDWLLYSDFEDWLKIELDEDANLALSDEEIDVLNNIPYPYFINGLAGSGKSTILYYLFALAFSHRNLRPADLLFLSYSQKLVEKAETVVKALLTRNPQYSGYKLSKSEENELNGCFHSFQDYLKETFLDTQDEIDRFAEVNHIKYEDFKNDYPNCQLPEARFYGDAMVWAVIRSFIKGRDYKTPFTIDDYRKLNERDRTLSSEDFEKVYKIWKHWYKEQYKDWWDDLDLISHVLKKIDKGFKYKKYDIVYCDEAQDFTPIENNLILKLSKYTDYNLNGYAKIPLAYAGDPNQTVTPTGFTWARLKQIFDNAFLSLVGEHIHVENKTLNNNYRSKRTIVEFANSIQYIRKSFINDDGQRPQEMWNPQENQLPGFFYISRTDGQPDDLEFVQFGFEKAGMIVLGYDNEDAIQNDELLNLSLNGDRINLGHKLYSAISSKGLEDKSVLLYRFADQLPASFSKMIDQNYQLTETERYELSHFFTKLYIAITRAKDLLCIADTQENYEKFWKHFVDNAFVKSAMANKQDRNAWENKCGGIDIGNADEFKQRMDENFDPIDMADDVFENAISSKSAKLMLRAAGYYKEGGDNNKAKLCHAYALLFEKEFEEAGNSFLKLGKKDEAEKSFWMGGCWQKLAEKSIKPSHKNAAKFMLNGIDLVEYIKTIENGNNLPEISRTDDTWNSVAVKINQSAVDTAPDYIHDVCLFLEQMVTQGFSLLNPNIAQLYYRNKQYQKAVEKWDDISERNNDNTLKAKKEYYHSNEELSKSTSEKIFWMDKGGKGEDILRNYSSPDDIRAYNFGDDTQKIIFYQLRQRPSRFEDALKYPLQDEQWKLQQLFYQTDSTKFLEKYVLQNFDDEKFTTWVEIPVSEQDFPVFDKVIPQIVFDKIFGLRRESWLKFMKLRDVNDERVMKNPINHEALLNSVISAMRNSNYPSIASCFIDIVFNNADYNFHNAKRYLDTLVSAFQNNNFSVRDFFKSAQENVYFDKCDLSIAEFDRIKDNLLDFSKTMVASYRRIKTIDEPAIKTLLRVAEKVVPLPKDDETGDVKVIYNFDKALETYNDLGRLDIIRNNKKIDYYLSIRKWVLKSLYSASKTIPEIDHDMSAADIVSTFDKEDSLLLIRQLFGYDIDASATIKEFGLLLAEIVYKHNLEFKDFERILFEKSRMQAIRKNVLAFADSSIDGCLKAKTIDEYAMKIYAYLYEVFGKDDGYIIKKYEDLLNNKRLEKRTALLTYFKRRILHYYSYESIKGKKYDSVCLSIGLSYPIDEAKSWKRPIIDKKTPKQAKTVSEEQQTTQAGKSQKQTSLDTKIKRPVPVDIVNSETDPVRKGQLEMAKNLKKQGVPESVILSAASLLTAEDLEKL